MVLQCCNSMSLDSDGDPSPNKRPDVLLSVGTWRGEAKGMPFHHTLSLQALLIFLFPLSVCKRYFEMFQYSSSFFSSSSIFLCCCFFYPFPLFSPILLSLNLFKLCLPSLLSLSSLPTSSPISFPLPCHLCTRFIMAD